jgi:hypothetical protein
MRSLIETLPKGLVSVPDIRLDLPGSGYDCFDRLPGDDRSRRVNRDNLETKGLL